MKNDGTKVQLVRLARRTILAALSVAAVFSSTGAFAGAVATDWRNGAWGTAKASEGSASTQLQLAINRAIRYGGTSGYIRAYQFTIPRGCYAAYATGYVSGKGWCGNWSYDANPTVAGQKARAGLVGQNASSICLQKVWQE